MSGISLIKRLKSFGLEKIILAIDVLNKDDDRVAKQLLTELLPKNVNGFCSELSNACRMFNISLDDFKGVADVRSKLKTRLIAIQAVRHVRFR